MESEQNKIIRFLLSGNKKKQRIFCLASILLVSSVADLNAVVQSQSGNFFTEPYDQEYEEAMAERMKKGIDTFLTNYTTTVIAEREKLWNRQFETPKAYKTSVEPNRTRLRKLIGAIDPRGPVRMMTQGDPERGNILAETQKSTVYRVEWTVIEGLTAEGLLLVPKGDIKASAVVIPDADEVPEAYAGLKPGPKTALRLAEGGTQVIVPILVNRDTRHSGSNELIPSNPWMSKDDSASVWTNQTHREWIHRQGYIMGRHIIGLEVQKVLAAVDWLSNRHPSRIAKKVGVMGYGEGGLLALYSAALDTRIDVAWVSGYFGPRRELWQEPVYRNVWGLLAEFGDAEIASMITPRSLVIEASPVPSVKEPRPPKEGQKAYALPGKLETPKKAEIEKEVERLDSFFPKASMVRPDVTSFFGVNQHGSNEALNCFASRMDIQAGEADTEIIVTDKRNTHDFQERDYRTFANMVEYIQDMIPTADRRRYAFLKGDFSSPESWNRDMEPYRERFYEELVGKIPRELLPMNPKLRQIYDEPGWKGYEVVLDVWPDVFSWGILAVPDNIKPGERRPAVVMQHGIGGLPTTPISIESYHKVLPALVNRGFVVFSPHNPYQFNIRKANAVKASVFSVIIPQHKQILNYLKSLEYVEDSRIALYGKSWGGRTALRVPIVLKDYSTVISSAYFNDWLRKTVSTDYRNSYYFEDSIGIYEWNMGNTFTHAEMAALIAPRPFMVESGYLDGVAAHEMVAYEYTKVKRLYDTMGIGDRIDLEFFMGGHDINGEGTFRFLHKQLNWPEPESPNKTQKLSR